MRRIIGCYRLSLTLISDVCRSVHRVHMIRPHHGLIYTIWIPSEVVDPGRWKREGVFLCCALELVGVGVGLFALMYMISYLKSSDQLLHQQANRQQKLSP